MAPDAVPDAPPDGDAAPAPLDRIEAFVNTRNEDRDDLDTPARLVEWLHARGLVPAGSTATAAQLDRAGRSARGSGR